MVNSITVIGDIFPPAERGKWQGLIGGIFALASITGPFLGGWVTDHFSWRWIFYFLTSMGMFGAILYIPVFAQGVIGVSATSSGLILMPMMISLVIASALGGQIISKTGKYKPLAIFGTLMIVLGMFL